MKDINIIITKDENKNIEPLKCQCLTIFPINKIKNPVNNIKQKILHKFNKILFFLF